MNPEILISQAAKALDMFKIDHEGVCCLIFKDGFVAGVPCSCVSNKHPKSLRVERYEIIRGFTSSRWNRIGRDLYILYSKEKQCQSHQKP